MIPVKAVYTGADVTALGEFATGDTVPLAHGGTGATAAGGARTSLGLGNVDNTSDVNKPVSTAQQTALNLKQDTLVSGTNIKTINGSSVLGGGNLVVSGGGTGPAFSAYQTVGSSLTSITYTKVVFPNEEFDTNSNYDTSTSRFTPTVAGYYQVNAGVAISASSTQLIVQVYKNGASYKSGGFNGNGTAVTNQGTVNALVYLNGTTDYIEVFAYQAAATQNTSGIANITYFQGFLARAA